MDIYFGYTWAHVSDYRTTTEQLKIEDGQKDAKNSNTASKTFNNNIIDKISVIFILYKNSTRSFEFQNDNCLLEEEIEAGETKTFSGEQCGCAQVGRVSTGLQA